MVDSVFGQMFWTHTLTPASEPPLRSQGHGASLWAATLRPTRQGITPVSSQVHQISWGRPKAENKRTCEDSLIQRCWSEGTDSRRTGSDSWGFAALRLHIFPACSKCSDHPRWCRRTCGLVHVHTRLSSSPPRTATPPPAASACQARRAPGCWASACPSAASWWRRDCSWRCGPAGWASARAAARLPCRCGRWHPTGCLAAGCYPAGPPASRRWASCNCGKGEKATFKMEGFQQ